MNWQEAIKKIFLIFAETAAGQPLPADRQQEVARLWLRHVEGHAQGHFTRKGVPRHEAEDLGQEVIFKLLRSRPLADVSHPQAYYYRILHNLFVDYLRQLRPGKVQPDDSPPGSSDDDEDDGDGFDHRTTVRHDDGFPGRAHPGETIDKGLGPDVRADLRRLLAAYEHACPLKYQRLALWVAGCSALEIASVELDIPVKSVTDRQAGNMTQSIHAMLKHFRAGPPWPQERRH